MTFAVKDFANGDNVHNEFFMEEKRRVQNSEMVFEEFEVKMYFAKDGLWDPAILQNENVGGSLLGSIASYRQRYIVSKKELMKMHLFHKG